jgi:perosamine synthetase
MNLLPVAGPSITQLEIEFVTDAVSNCWYSNANKYIKLFENDFSKFCNRKFAISLPSCTSGIHLSLLALNIGFGDEVIVPDITWIASAAPLQYVGAIPIFADIRDDNLTIDHTKLEALISNKTKAIICVNLYGAMPDYDEIFKICKKYNLALIEDAAESIGSTFKGMPSGSFGDFSVFSFHGSKTLTTGEGGMLLTDNENLFNRCMTLRDHGRIPGDNLFLNNEIAYKYKMTDLQAALGLAQLKRIKELLDGKRKIFEFYINNFKIKDVTLSFESNNVYNSYWMSSIVWSKSDYGLSKFDFIKLLRDYGIDSRPIFSPLSSLKAYKHLNNNHNHHNEVSYRYADVGINLPSALSLDTNSLKFIVETTEKILLSNRLGKK